MRNLSNFIFKILTRGILFPLLILIVNYHFIYGWNYYISRANEPFLLYFHMRSYTTQTLALFITITIMYYINNHYDEIKLLTKNSFVYYSGIVYGIFKYILVICMIPVFYYFAFCLIHGVDNILNTTNIFIKMLIFEWILPLTSLAVLLGFVSITIKNKIIKYSLSSLIFYLVSGNILTVSMKLNDTFIRSIIKYINIFSDMAYTRYSYTMGYVFDQFYIMDKSICFIIIATCFLLLYFKNKFKGKNKYKILTVISTSLILSLSSLIYNIGYNIHYTNEDYTYNKEFDSLDIANKYKITNYSMNLNLDNRLNNNVSLNFKNISNEKISNIDLILDDIFKVDEIVVNNKKLDFIHEENILNINIPNDMLLDNNFEIKISYSGFVHVLNSVYQYMYIANSNNVMLPMDSLAWYPKTNDNNMINFDININSKNKVYSNLELTKIDINGSNYELKYTGNSNDVFLYSGNYKEVIENDIVFIYPQDLDLHFELQLGLFGNLNNDESSMFKDLFNNKQIKKVVFGRKSDSNGFVNYQLLDNILLINLY